MHSGEDQGTGLEMENMEDKTDNKEKVKSERRGQ
jgi:hypothetical protein